MYATFAQWMFHNFCEVSSDFSALLGRLRDPLQLRASEVVVQFPFVMPVTEEKTEEELTRIAERRKEQGKKLQEMAANKRLEKVGPDSFMGLYLTTFLHQLLQKENDFQYLTDLKASKGIDNKKEWMVRPAFPGLKFLFSTAPIEQTSS
jgi:actin-related protein 5